MSPSRGEGRTYESRVESLDPQHAVEVETLAFIPALPFELQSRIFAFCDSPSLSALSQLSKGFHMRFLPLLWQNINFGTDFGDEAEEASQDFFSLCRDMMKNDPERFATLASHVRILDAGWVDSLEISDLRVWTAGDFDLSQLMCVFDVIAMFSNLESLSIYVKATQHGACPRHETGEALAKGLRSLQCLKIGGHIPCAVLSGLLANGQSLRDLTLINIIPSPSQSRSPDTVAWLSDADCTRLSRLRKLHLCKLAELDGHARYRDRLESGQDSTEEGGDESLADSYYLYIMSWKFPQGGELKLLAEWANLLQSTSDSLQSLRLENRFLCGDSSMDYESDFLKPSKAQLDDYGSISIAVSQRVLLPMLRDHNWPELKELTLAGMGELADNALPLAHLKGRVRVQHLSSRWQYLIEDVVPEQISVPHEFEHDGRHHVL